MRNVVSRAVAGVGQKTMAVQVRRVDGGSMTIALSEPGWDRGHVWTNTPINTSTFN